MRLAVHFANFTLPGAPGSLAATLAETAKAADEGGCSAFTLMDHYFQMESLATAQDPMLEGYTALGFLAGQTSRISLGLLVTGVTYRHPGLLAKIVTTLDVLSQGRAILGIGAAWYEREHVGLGVPFPPLAERFERLEEALAICRQMWSDDDGPFDGRHYHLTETVCSPRPIQPRPHVMIGGSGERKTLRLVAQYADACNLFDTDAATVGHKLQVLDRHCAEVGRDPAEVSRTVITSDDPFGASFRSKMAEYAALGLEQVWVGPGTDVADPVGWVTDLTEQVLPGLAELEPARG